MLSFPNGKTLEALLRDKSLIGKRFLTKSITHFSFILQESAYYFFIGTI